MSAKRNWILAIVGLLGGNLVAMGVIAYTAHAKQAQIIPAYDVVAAHHDETMDEARRSQALGWSATVQLAAGVLEVRVVDATGAALPGATVRVTGYPRAHASAVIDVTLGAAGGGSYRVPLRAIGWHDLTIIVEREGVRFSQRTAVEAR